MERFELVIVGGGLASARAIRSYRDAGGGGRIALLSREPTLPYHRPALSKRYLRGETDEIPYVEDRGFYDKAGVDVRLGTTVVNVDAAARTIATTAGARVRYGKLLIATGANPRRLTVPGADLEGVFGLRTVADSAAIREAARGAGRAVVVGGGFIGMEAAASLRRLGLAVTLVHLGSGLFDQLGSEQLSDELAMLYRDNGVDVLVEEEVARFDGGVRLTSVATRSGLRIPADLAVVGVGVAPATEVLAGSGIHVHNGILVNDRFEGSAPNVYAVGDVANFFDPLFRRRRRLEHWSNAGYQGDAVGRALAGEEARYDDLSSFFSEVFGHTVRVFGDVGRFDELRSEGSLDSGFLAHYGRRGRLVGALTVGQDDETETRLKRLIRAGASLAEVTAGELVGSGR
jgi:NADPH-dependent 2,4-dienoyl-CoA reductase/sulfur reductase-like enzyme